MIGRFDCGCVCCVDKKNEGFDCVCDGSNVLILFVFVAGWKIAGYG